MTTGDKELVINGVCVRNNANEGDDDDVNMEKSNDDDEQNEHDDDENKRNDDNDEDDIRRNFMNKPSLEDSNDVQVKKELEEAGGWEF